MNRPLASYFDRIAKLVASPHFAKAGLVCGGIALAAGALGAVLSAIYPHPPGEIETAERAPEPRLPRARPVEPVTTGSIKPAAPVPKGDDPDGLGAAHAAEAARLEGLRASAILVAGSRTECGTVIDTELLENRPLDLVVVLVRCGSGIRIYLDEVDIEASSARPAPAPESVREQAALTDAQALRDCEEKVRRGLAQPASLSRLASSTGIDRVPGGDAIVTFDFNALNGLGFPLAMQAQCVFSESELARLEVSPR